MKRLVTILCVLLLLGMSAAQRSSTSAQRSLGQQALAYSLEHRVGLAAAAKAIGVDLVDASEDLGFTGVLGFLEAIMDASLLQATCWSVWTSLSGSAEKGVGLTEHRVSNIFRLRMANDASFLPECPSDGSGDQPYMYFRVGVWTVGDDYPVAYLFEVEGNIYPTYEGRPNEPVESRWLGYANASQIEGQLQQVLRDAVEDFAIRYLNIARYR